jgi:hypothetical protein
MSDRERWVLYPLLCLALGAGLWNKLAPPVQLEASQVKCRELVIVDENEQRKVLLTSGSEGGAIVIWNATDDVMLTIGHQGPLSGMLMVDPKTNDILRRSQMIQPSRQSGTPAAKPPAPAQPADPPPDKS